MFDAPGELHERGYSTEVFLGDGSGRLEPAGTLPTRLGATSLALGQLNADGDVDLVVSLCSPGCVDGTIAIYPGDGQGGFGDAELHHFAGVPYNVALADFDADGRLDVAATDYPNDRLLLLLSDWKREGYSRRELPTGSKPIALEVGDVNGDGVPDLISSDHGAASSSLYLSYGNGEFSERIEIATGPLPYAIALDSVDGDEIADLVIAHSTLPGRVTVLQGRGDGTFARLDTFEATDRLVYVDLADLDHDGRLDIVVTRDQLRSADAYLNEGDGLFRHEPIGIPAENKVYSLVITDLDGDPFPDLVTVDYERNTLSVAIGGATH